MKQFLKRLLYLLLFVVGLIAVLFSLDEIERKLEAWFYEPPSELEGISVGMHERDVAFKTGDCSEPNFFMNGFTTSVLNGNLMNLITVVTATTFQPLLALDTLLKTL